MMKTALAILFAATVLSSHETFAVTPAEQRMQAARGLQATFDASLVKGLELKFAVRGSRCDVLHVQGAVNLTEGMMQALGNGTLIYGRVLPEGVNQYAFRHAFRGVAYTNAEDSVYAFFGTPTFSRSQVKQMRRCTDAIAAKLTSPESVSKPPSAPPFVPLSWSTARVGTKLYDGAFKHEATIVAVIRDQGIIEVRYVKSGAVEPKLLNAVARFWYVRK